MKAFYEKTVLSVKLDATLNKLKENFYSKTNVSLAIEYAPTKEPVPFAERLRLKYTPISVGEKWGDLFDCAWFHITGNVSDELKDKKLALLIDLNGEGCIYDENGSATQGLTTINSDFDRALGDPDKREYVITEKSNGQEVIDIYVDGGCNDLFGYVREGGTVKQVELVIVNDDIKDLYYDFWVLYDLIQNINENTTRYSRILLALNKVCDELKDMNAEQLARCKSILKSQLDLPQGETGLKFYATGHAHLDLGWLWPIRETKRKALRTFSTALKNIEKYPFYIFGASQPQQFEWVKQNDPILFERLKEQVKAGRVELQGAMWVEADQNLISGESIIRQIYYGQKFWQEEFGVKATTAHLPDVFGFGGALPQILKKCGINYLLTIKPNWNRYNPFPYRSFKWQGIDGSEIFVHMPPEMVYNDEVQQPLGIYNSKMAPASVLAAERDYPDRGVCGVAEMLYGIGDGGGGPGEGHLERLKRVQRLNGLCQVIPGKTSEMFRELETYQDELKTYSGEIYLERHQGTYTTQGKVKYYNTVMQKKLRDCEFWSTVANKKTGATYPQEELDEIWKEVLLYQFHDILPGSSIKRVYDECIARYEQMEARLDDLIANAKSALGIGEKLKEQSKRIPFDFGNVMETDSLKIIFNDNGEIISLFDKVLGRETLKKPSNVLCVFADGNNAWDMPEGYLNSYEGKFKLVNADTYREGKMLVRVQKLVFNDSVIEQVITAKDGETVLRFDNKIDWRERLSFLKNAIFADVFTDTINCGCAFGNVKRSLNKNIPHELAQTEICAHRYADVSSANAGLAIFNDCKYGLYADKNVLLMSILRGTENPGKNADYGEHEFSFALYSHGNSFENSDVSDKAYRFTNGERLEKQYDGFVDVSAHDGVILESVKQSYDKKGVILRVCEEKGVEGKVELKVGFEYKNLYLVSPDSEDVIAELGETAFTLKPFEFITVKIV